MTKDIRSRGRTDGSSRRHSSCDQLLNSSSRTAFAATARSCDIFRPRNTPSNPSRQRQDRKPPPSRRALRALRRHQDHREEAGCCRSAVRLGRARPGTEPGLSGPRRTRLTGARSRSRGSAPRAGPFLGGERSQGCGAGNVALRRFGEVRAEAPRFARVCPPGAWRQRTCGRGGRGPCSPK